jgi:hypothetical protein
MRKTFGMNKHQKAVYKKGEQKVSREQVSELLEMAESDDPEDRLVAAENLCPCHVRTRIPAVWEALFRMMEDTDARVRRAAWHTIEDGGKPTTEAEVERLERLCRQEQDARVRQFAEFTLNKVLGADRNRDLAALWLAGRPERKPRGKCDFCGETDVPVQLDLQTMIPTDTYPRAARICDSCAKTCPPGPLS